MSISEDTAALVAAQLTNAWAARMGHASDEQRGKIGPNLIEAYRTFYTKVMEVSAGSYDMENWL